MKSIAAIKTQATDIGHALVSATRIDVPDVPLGQGGFGVVYKVSRVDGHPAAPLVVKLLTDAQPGTAQRGFDTIQELQRRLQRAEMELRRRGASLLGRYPALAGVPHLSFEGTMDGRPVLGYVCEDLGAAGLEDFEAILEDDGRTSAYQRLPIGSRLQRALQLVDAFEFLGSRIQYIHADIKAEALFVDPRRTRVAIIDFDSGAVARDASDTPTTFGTKQDWLAPEITRQLDQPANTSRIIQVNLLSDVWAVNMAVHYLICGFSPFFFFTEISDRSMAAYRARFKWPNADASFPFYRRDYEALHRQYVSWLASALPNAIVERLAFTFNEGYDNPAMRTSSGQWKTILGSQQRPAIKRFNVDRVFVDDARPVRLSWEVAGANSLELSDVGPVNDRDHVDVHVTADTDFTLTLTPFQGKPISRTVRVEVSKAPPVIAAFDVSPAFLAKAVPARLSWRVQGAAYVEIDTGVGDVTGRTFVDVLPTADTSYMLMATNLFGVVARERATVRVSRTAPVIRNFTATPPRLVVTPDVELMWDVADDAHRVEILGLGLVGQCGRMQLTQRSDTIYVLRATSYFGVCSEARAVVSVSDVPPRITRFTASTPFAHKGQKLELDWRVEGAGETWLEPARQAVTPVGHLTVVAGDTPRYVLRARSYFGAEATASLTMHVIEVTSLASSSSQIVRETPTPTVLRSATPLGVLLSDRSRQEPAQKGSAVTPTTLSSPTALGPPIAEHRSWH